MIFWTLCLSAVAQDADFVLVQADMHNDSAAAVVTTAVLPDEGGPRTLFQDANGYEATFVNAAPHFKVLGPIGGTPCGKRVKTSVTAQAAGCKWATNGAPFNMKTGDCDCGVAIHDGTVFGTGGWNVQFGVTGSGSWVIGTLNASVAAKLNVSNSINGFNWLVPPGHRGSSRESTLASIHGCPTALQVRNGLNVVGNDTAVAPRTAIGVTKEGRLLSLEVDGCEVKSHSTGRS